MEAACTPRSFKEMLIFDGLGTFPLYHENCYDFKVLVFISFRCGKPHGAGMKLKYSQLSYFPLCHTVLDMLALEDCNYCAMHPNSFLT